jgi:hypothetical protein
MNPIVILPKILSINLSSLALISRLVFSIQLHSRKCLSLFVNTSKQVGYYGIGQRWRCINGYGNRSFGGSFSGLKIDYIASHFRDWLGTIDPGQSELVAQAAIASRRTAPQGVAA